MVFSSWEMVDYVEDSIAECEDRVGILEAFKDGEAHEDIRGLGRGL